MSESIKILYIEDNPADVRLIKEMLSEFPGKFDLEAVNRLSDGIKRIYEETYDIVLVDLGLPDSSGIDTFNKLLSAQFKIPVIILSGLSNEDLAIQAVKGGAQSYLLKDKTNAHTLKNAIRYSIERFRLFLKLQASEQNLQHINRLLVSIRNINQAIVHEKNKQKLLGEICEILVEVTGYSFCVIGLLDENSGDLLPTACWGLGSDECNKRCMMASEEYNEKECPAAEAVKKKEPIIIDNIEKSRKYKSWKKNVVEFGFKSFVTFPIIHSDNTYGYLSVYCTQEGFFGDETEIELLEEVANDIGLALNSMTLEEERIRAEQRERHLNNVLLGIRNVNQLIVSETDPERIIEQACENLTQTLGYNSAWIALLDKTGDTVTRIASSGLRGGYNTLKKCLDGGEFPECMRRCLAIDETVITKKQSKECSECPIAEKDVEGGSLTHRLSHGDHLYGVITVSVSELYLHDPEELDLFREVAEDIGFALHKIEEGESLRKHREMLSAAMHLGRLAWWDMELPGGRVICDDQLLEMLGRDLEDFRDVDFRAFTRLIHPEDYKPAIQAMRDHLEGKTDRYSVEYRIQKEDGTWLWLHDSGGIVERDADGSPRRFAGIVMNIDDRKRVEEAHREGEERYRELFDNIRSGVAVYEAVDDGEDFIFKDFNRAGEKIDGLEKKDVIGKRLTERFPGVKELGLFEVLQRVWRTGELEFLPAAIYKDERGQGGWRENWVYKLPSGEIVSVYDDVTERKRAEEALRESEKRLNEAQHIAKMGDFVWDVKTGNATWSDGLYSLFGYDTSDKVDYETANAHLFHPEDRERINGWLDECILSGSEELTPNEFRLIRKDGEVIYVRTVGKIEHSEDGSARVFATVQDITERKQADEAIRKSEEKHRLLAENTLDVIWMVNQDFEFEYVNPAIYEMTGYTPEEWIGSSLADHVDEAQFRRLAKLPASQGTKGSQEKGVRFITEMFKKDGTSFDAEIHSKMIFDENGDFVCFQGVTRDITKRRIAERELAERERLLTFAIEQVPVPIIIATAPDVVITRYNEAAVDMLAVVPDDVTDIPPEERRSYWPTFHPDGTPYTVEDLPLTRAVKEGVVTRNEEMIIRQNGRDRWISSSAAPLYDENGDIMAGIVVFPEITDIKKAHDELHEKETLLRNIIDTSPECIFIKDKEGRYILVNDAIAEIYDQTPEDMLGKSDRDFFDTSTVESEDLEKFIRDDRDVIERQCAKFILEERFRKPNGETLWFQTTKIPLTIKDQPEYLLGVAVDITERKEMEMRISEQMAFLRELLDVIPVPVFIKDTKGRYIDCNRAFTEALGYDEQAIIDKSVYDIASGKVADIYHDKDAELFAEGGVQVYESQVKYVDSRLHDVILHKTLFRDLEGDVAGIIGVIHDITEHKAAQEALVHSMRNYEAIYDASTDCIFVHDDRTGEIVDANQATADTFGYTKEEIRRLCVGDLSLNEPPFTQEEAMGFIQKAVTEGPQHFEWLAKKKNGELIWFENSLQYTNLAGEQRVLVIGRDITDRKQAEEAVKKSEEKYRNLVENLNEGIWSVDDRGYTTFVNSSMAGMLGYEIEEMIGRHFFRYMNEHWQKVYGEMWEQRRDDFFGEHELEFLKKDGGTLYAYLNTSPLYDERGEYIGGMAAVTNVTQRRLAEEELRQSEELFRNVFFHHSAVKLLVDPVTGDIVDVNEAAAKYYGWPIERLKQMKIQDINTLSFEELKQEMEMARSSERNRFEFRHRRADGSIRDVVVHSSKIEAKGKELLHSIIHDITDRKQYEDALRESEEKFRNFFETSRDVIYITDADGTIIDVNPAVEVLYGYDRNKLIGQKVNPVYSNPDDRERFQEQITQNGFVKDFEVLYRDKEGVNHYCLETATVRRDGSGNIIGYQGFIRDNTERVKMQERLIQAEKLSSLGGILSGVAHELNNPLTAIIGNAQLLKRMDVTTEIKQKLDTIYKESFRCTKIVGGLLAFAREHKPERIMTNINEIIMEAYKLREYELRVDDVSLRTELDETLPEISVDPYQIQQVLMNLVNNAHHALRDKGGGSVMIKSRRQDNRVIIECIDDGPGIPEEIKRKIFDPFFTTKEIGEGTGLGLSICYGIVREHDGSIEVESHPGFGTRFIVELPISHEISSESRGTPVKPIPKPEGMVSVLIIEDEASLRNFVSDALELEGFKVVSTESADHAVDIVKDQPFDAIVSDMKMPGMSGQNFYTYLQKYHPELTEKIIFITGDVLGKETQRFFKITGCRYIEKPFEIDDLMIVLVELVQKERKKHTLNV